MQIYGKLIQHLHSELSSHPTRKKHIKQRDHEIIEGTYNISAAEKSCLLKPNPALYLVKEADALSNPISAPRVSSLLPIAAANSSKGVGVKPMLELKATRSWR